MSTFHLTGRVRKKRSQCSEKSGGWVKELDRQVYYAEGSKEEEK